MTKKFRASLKAGLDFSPIYTKVLYYYYSFLELCIKYPMANKKYLKIYIRLLRLEKKEIMKYYGAITFLPNDKLDCLSERVYTRYKFKCINCSNTWERARTGLVRDIRICPCCGYYNDPIDMYEITLGVDLGSEKGDQNGTTQLS